MSKKSSSVSAVFMIFFSLAFIIGGMYAVMLGVVPVKISCSFHYGAAHKPSNICVVKSPALLAGKREKTIQDVVLARVDSYRDSEGDNMYSLQLKNSGGHTMRVGAASNMGRDGREETASIINSKINAREDFEVEYKQSGAFLIGIIFTVAGLFVFFIGISAMLNKKGDRLYEINRKKNTVVFYPYSFSKKYRDERALSDIESVKEVEIDDDSYRAYTEYITWLAAVNKKDVPLLIKMNPKRYYYIVIKLIGADEIYFTAQRGANYTHFFKNLKNPLL